MVMITGIRRLQLILLKVSLILGVQVYPKCGFIKLVEPTDGKEFYINLLSVYSIVATPASNFKTRVKQETTITTTTKKQMTRTEQAGLCSSSARWPLAANFCPWRQENLGFFILVVTCGFI